MPFELVLMFSIMIALFIVINYAIHIHYGKKRELVISNLRLIEYEYFKDVKVRVKGRSKFGFYFRKMKADIGIYKDNIIMLPYNQLPLGLKKQFQPITQYSIDSNQRKLIGTSIVVIIEKIWVVNNTLFLEFGTSSKSLKGKTIIEFNFSHLNANLKDLLENRMCYTNH